MPLLEKAVIEGVWGSRKVMLRFFKDATFLIGRNGSGKTTAINLVAAALKGDVKTLLASRFSTITLTLGDFVSSTSEKNKSILRIEKNDSHESEKKNRTHLLRYLLRRPGSADWEELDPSVEPQRRGVLGLLTWPYPLDADQPASPILRELCNVSWLSIHRGDLAGSDTRSFNSPWADRSYDSTVDRKLSELVIEIGRYFAQLSQRADEKTNSFHKDIFLALLAPSPSKLLSISLNQEQIVESKRALVELINEFHFDSPEHIKDYINKHYSSVEAFANRVRENKEPAKDKSPKAPAKDKAPTKDKKQYLAETGEIAAWFLHTRIEQVAADWRRTRAERAQIFAPRSTFLTTINNLLINKEIDVDDKNVLGAVTVSGERIGVEELSSGEKQLLILLGEALIRRDQEVVYIADEPELSLHVSWQEQLVPSIHLVHPTAQIIFATHSPDIVGGLSDRVIDMEKTIQ